MNKFIPISQPSIGQKEIKYVNDAMKSGWVSSIGDYIDKFESKFAKFCGTKYAVAVSNGTVALHLSLAALNIKRGDEVIVPDLTFIATANAVSYIGAKPVFADIDKETLCIDPESIRRLITNKIKAIIPVHLYGHPANMNAINKIAKEFDLKVVEDAAESHGAGIDGKLVGSFGDCGTFSFYGNKLMTSGEGGMIVTDNKKLLQRLRFLRDHAMDSKKRYWHDEIGFNYRITNIQAALGLAQLERLDKFIQKRKDIFRWYQNNLSGMKGLNLNFTKKDCDNVYWFVCLLIDNFNLKKRDRLSKLLKERGVDSRPFFYPNSQMPMYKTSKTDKKNPISNSIYSRGICLPSYYDMTKKDVDTVSKVLLNILNGDS